jgi:copper(I)-binding protein
VPIQKSFEKRAVARVGLAVCGLFAATALVGCGAGQISQVATQEPAVNGTGGTINTVALRNVHLQAVQTSDSLKPGTEVDLIFTATNQSPDTNDRLLRITSDVGTVTLAGDTALPANGILEVGQPDGIEELAALPEAADGAEAMVALSEPISNGLTYPFTFTFENAGDKTLDVPISAGNAPRQGEGSAGESHGSGH